MCGPVTRCFPAKAPAHWLMCVEVPGGVLVVPRSPTHRSREGTGDDRADRGIGLILFSGTLLDRTRSGSGADRVAGEFPGDALTL